MNKIAEQAADKLLAIVVKREAANKTREGKKVAGTDIKPKVEETETKQVPIDVEALAHGNRESAKDLCEVLEDKYGTPSTESIKQAFKEGVAIALAENGLIPSDLEKSAVLGLDTLASKLTEAGVDTAGAVGKILLGAALMGPPVIGATLGGLHGSLQRVDPEDVESLKGYDEVQTLRHGAEQLRKTIQRKKQGDKPELVEEGRVH